MKRKIHIKKHVDDPSLSWEERYKKLEAHHKEETEFLIMLIEELEWNEALFYSKDKNNENGK